MQASTPLAPGDARLISLRQGLFFGISAGCLALLITAFSIFSPLAGFSLNFVYTLAFVAFFFAGWRAAKKTNRIDMGALAGFWAGVAVAVLWLFTLFAVFFREYHRSDIRLSSIVTYAFSGIFTALLALLFGPAIGALGGFISKMYAENSVARPTTSMQSPSPSVQPATIVPPTQPSPPQQNQP